MCIWICNLTPTIIDKPTRVHNNSYSLIDNIFSSDLDDNISIPLEIANEVMNTPLYKSDDESDLSNYRPKWLLSIFNWIFKKMMYYRLKSYLKRYNILDNSHYGFREKRSTEHAILDIIKFKPIWIKNCTYAVYLLISRRPSTPCQRLNITAETFYL